MKYAQAWDELKDWLNEQRRDAEYGIAEGAFFEVIAKIDDLENEYE